MKPIPILLFILLFSVIHRESEAQELDKSTTISFFTGMINYQGDVNPNSFTFKHSNFATGLVIRKPLNRWFTLRGGVNVGTIEAADKWNRDHLKSRNLSFTSSIKEAYLALEVSVLDMSIGRFTPYLYGGIAVFHFNPWTRDKNGVKTFLKPLSTEGQGLPQYPERKPYKLTQIALPFGGGAKYAISDGFSVGVELSQRKSFTDYIDDVSTNFVDGNILLQERGPKAVELAYRSDELPGGRPLFPLHGDQRGTPTEVDWYYFFGVTLEMKINKIGGVLNIFNKGVPSQRCPSNMGY